MNRYYRYASQFCIATAFTLCGLASFVFTSNADAINMIVQCRPKGDNNARYCPADGECPESTPCKKRLTVALMQCECFCTALSESNCVLPNTTTEP